MEFKENKYITIENTRTIFMTNFSGDPERDKYGSNLRQVNIVIPDDIAEEMKKEGFNIKQTKPKPGEEEGFIPVYYVKAILRFRNAMGSKTKNPPAVYKVSGEMEPTLMTEENIGLLDNITIKSIDVVLKGWWFEDREQYCCDVKTMYVIQDVEMDDPFMNKWVTQANDNDLPF